MLISVLLPFSNFKIELELPVKSKFTENFTPENLKNEIIEFQYQASEVGITADKNTSESKTSLADLLNFIKKAYWIITIALFIRILFQLLILFFHFYKGRRVKSDSFVLVYNSGFKHSFSFFNWIFLNPGFSSHEESGQIISHEKIHASQYHSIDLIIIELLAAAMWFNPLIWMMRTSIQLVHEYLADEGVLGTGIDRFRYQALLINRIAEERFICISSGFNDSIIKKRMIMMNKSKFVQRTKFKFLALIPITAILFFGIACIKGKDQSNAVNAVELVRMNVLYLGVENPVKIAASGYESSELTASIDNGTITGDHGEFIIKPKEAGSATVTISCKGKEIQKTQFRVKTVPDPVAAIKITSGNQANYLTGGTISKMSLLSSQGIEAVMFNFDFDLSFTIVSFVLSVTVPNSNIVIEEISKSGLFSDAQRNLLNSLVKNQKLMVEEIKATGPDGAERKLNSMVFTISGE